MKKTAHIKLILSVQFEDDEELDLHDQAMDALYEQVCIGHLEPEILDIKVGKEVFK